jgi:DNA-binding NarL/FixJ family response regulator
MPLMDGIAATEQISRDRDLSGVRVLVLTTFDTEEEVLASVRAGASGYLLKDIDGPGLRQAIRDVASGDSIADPSLTAILFRQAARTAHRPEMVSGLSERETEVLALVGGGLTNAEVAQRLFLSPETVRTYVSRLRTKTGARDRAQLVVLAYESGLVTPGSF